MIIPFKSGACVVSSPYGMRTLYGVTAMHSGIDLVGLDGDRILVAPCDGVVGVSTIVYKDASVGRTWEWGNYVRIDTEDGYKIYLCHMEERYVKAGQTVSAGEPLGVQGSTGYAFGEHCHFEVRKDGVAVNPCPFLGIENTAGFIAKNPPIPEWCADAVAWAREKGILKGTGNGHLDLDAPCTRAQVLTFLYRFYQRFI